MAEATSNGSAEGRAMTLEVLVSSYASAVLAVCLANTRNFHDAEDVMQDVFLKAVSNLGSLRDQTKVRAWLLQIARRTCIDHRRRRVLTATMPDDVPAPTRSTGEDVERLHAAIARLPENYRETIALYYLDGRNCASVAEALDITESAVRQRLVRARLMLHDLLAEDET